MHGFARSSIVGLVAALAVIFADAANQDKPIRIGMPNTFLYEKSQGFVEIITNDFKEVMKQTSGLTGELIPKYGPLEVAEKLNNKQMDFGIFHAHELAWVQKKYPDLQPLVIAADKQHVERVYLIVHKKNPAKTIADLRGKKIDIPVATKAHCRMFLEKQCADKAQKGPAAFFGSIEKSATQAEALDDVARDKVQATVVDTLGLEFYKEVKGPVFAKNLRVLQQSETFPPAVIVYKRGALDAATVKQFRDGMLKVHTTEKGDEMMKTWHIDAFEVPNKDYSKSLADVLKRYPAPASLR
jgi:ABC-type phosphate/phosphonate transport system substrate-binding protein